MPDRTEIQDSGLDRIIQSLRPGSGFSAHYLDSARR